MAKLGLAYNACVHLQVKLVPYNPEYMDESVMWTESKDVGKGFRCIRMVNNIHLNFDAFNGDKDHGGVHDGTTVVLWEWCKGDNQRWKIIPWCKSSTMLISYDLPMCVLQSSEHYTWFVFIVKLKSVSNDHLCLLAFVCCRNAESARDDRCPTRLE